MRLIRQERLTGDLRTAVPGSGYRWIALSNTTLGTLMATINGSIILIALPDIFRGIGVNPLRPGDASLLLLMILGYLLVTAVLVVTFGRLGDMLGRVRIYNLGFAVFTIFSILLGVTWLHGTAGALWLIAMRILQAVGGAMLFANAAAILTDAFPDDHRGMALGLNQVAGIAGQFVGLILGGLLGPVEWHLVFLVSVPFGVFATFWAYRKLRELGERRPVLLDWWRNLTFGAGLRGRGRRPGRTGRSARPGRLPGGRATLLAAVRRQITMLARQRRRESRSLAPVGQAVTAPETRRPWQSAPIA
jgi:MFS family permease